MLTVRTARRIIRAVIILTAVVASPSVAAFAQQAGSGSGAPSPGAPPADAPFLRDRGPGMATSMFGTYVRTGEWLVYPFYEHYRDRNLEYAPSEFGVSGATDYRGRYRADEALLWLGYGISDRLAVEFEVATIRASLEKAAGDVSALPARLEESGLGDVEGQVRWRWRRETVDRPEVFSYGEAVVPHHASRPLTGTSGWELKFGTGVIKGLPWGTVTARAAVEYAESSSSHFDVGEFAVEYLRRVSPAWRVFAALEGHVGELSAVAEAQWHLTPNVFLRLNSGFGLTSKAADWTPEVGVVWALPGRQRQSSTRTAGGVRPRMIAR